MGYLKAVVLVIGLLFFSSAAFLAALIVLPFTLIDPRLRYRMNHFFVTPFGLFARVVVGIQIDVLHRERLFQFPSAVYIGNHQSGLDLAVISYACLPGTLIVGKKELMTIPVFGWFFAMAGNLLIDRKNPTRAKAQLASAREKMIEHKLNLAIFPEGTRSKDQTILPFKKGAFYMAAELKLPIVPVVCSSLKRIGVWEKAELDGGQVYLSVLPSVSMEGVTPDAMPALIDRVRYDMVAEFNRLNAAVQKGVRL